MNLLRSEPWPGFLRSDISVGQPDPQEPGGEPGPARPQQPAVVLHPLLLPPADRRTSNTRNG